VRCTRVDEGVGSRAPTARPCRAATPCAESTVRISWRKTVAHPARSPRNAPGSLGRRAGDAEGKADRRRRRRSARPQSHVGMVRLSPNAIALTYMLSPMGMQKRRRPSPRPMRIMRRRGGSAMSLHRPRRSVERSWGVELNPRIGKGAAAGGFASPPPRPLRPPRAHTYLARSRGRRSTCAGAPDRRGTEAPPGAARQAYYSTSTPRGVAPDRLARNFSESTTLSRPQHGYPVERACSRMNPKTKDYDGGRRTPYRGSRSMPRILEHSMSRFLKSLPRSQSLHCSRCGPHEQHEHDHEHACP